MMWSHLERVYDYEIAGAILLLLLLLCVLRCTMGEYVITHSFKWSEYIYANIPFWCGIKSVHSEHKHMYVFCTFFCSNSHLRMAYMYIYIYSHGIATKQKKNHWHILLWLWKYAVDTPFTAAMHIYNTIPHNIHNHLIKYELTVDSLYEAHTYTHQHIYIEWEKEHIDCFCKICVNLELSGGIRICLK